MNEYEQMIKFETYHTYKKYNRLNLLFCSVFFFIYRAINLYIVATLVTTATIFPAISPGITSKKL
ncbi:unnamed protein product [Commensalibacter communis]|nr:unnamed protein product [Commensalibacter communis]